MTLRLLKTHIKNSRAQKKTRISEVARTHYCGSLPPVRVGMRTMRLLLIVPAFLSFLVLSLISFMDPVPIRPILRTPITVYSPSKYNSTVAICLLVKNESLYIDEWIE